VIREWARERFWDFRTWFELQVAWLNGESYLGELLQEQTGGLIDLETLLEKQLARLESMSSSLEQTLAIMRHQGGSTDLAVMRTSLRDMAQILTETALPLRDERIDQIVGELRWVNDNLKKLIARGLQVRVANRTVELEEAPGGP